MTKLKYIGSASLPDVPARDLSDEEADRFGIERLLASGLYVLVEEPKPVPRPRRIVPDEKGE